jgi:hypothetical protein
MANSYLSRTIGTPTNAKKGTISLWVKRGNLTDGRLVNSWGGSSVQFFTLLQSNATIFIGDYDDPYNFELKTNRVFRDTSAWYHFVFSFDTTQGTASDRVKFYVNGIQETSFSTETYPSQNLDLNFGNSGDSFRIGVRDAEEYFDGSMSHVHFIDGTAYAPTSFGQSDSNGVWIPKPSPSVTYGTNGFFLKMDNSGNMGLDSSGNSNNFTTSGTITQAKDTPSNVFATLNPLNRHAQPILYKNGNTVAYDTSSNFNTAFSTLGMSSGKYYFEAKTSTNNGFVGICQTDKTYPAQTAGVYLGHGNLGNASWGYYADNGNYFHNGSGTSYGNSWTNTDVIGCALDLDNNKLYFSKNGTWQNSGVPTSGSTGTGAISITASSYFFGVTKDTESSEMQTNFGNGYFGTTAVTSAGTNASGNGIFEYDVPTGYTALSTKGLDL